MNYLIGFICFVLFLAVIDPKWAGESVGTFVHAYQSAVSGQATTPEKD